MNVLPSSPRSGSSAKPDGASLGNAGWTRDLRLRKHADYQRVYRAARKQFSSSVTWFVAQRTEIRPTQPSRSVGCQSLSGPRVGLTAGKVLGKAHERNRIKRRMREAVRTQVAELPAGIDLILHPKRSVLTVEFAKLQAEVLRIFRQAAAQGAAPKQPAAPPQARL